MAAAIRTFQLGGVTQTCPCHVCAFFSSTEEENAVLLPFMAEGIAAGDKCVNIIDERNRTNRTKALRAAGIDVASAEKSGQLELRPWEQAHIISGWFDKDLMLRSLDEGAASAASSFPATRLWSNQEWALQDLEGVEDIVEYESQFNDIWPKHNDVTVCVYDSSKFEPELLKQILRVHPFAIIGGTLIRNESYVPPDQFSKELGARSYKFALCKAGEKTEVLGSMTLASNAAAVAFCKRIILDLMVEDPRKYAGWRIDITEGERTIRSIRFSGTDRNH